MAIFFQQDIDGYTKLGVWKIEEEEDFFLSEVASQRNVSHPHKKLQHLAGRYLLKFLFPDFPVSLIQIADTRKPFLQDEAYHFSISHCGDYAAAIVSKNCRVGLDIETPTEKVLKILHKFLHPEEKNLLAQCNPDEDEQLHIRLCTLLWSAKESMFKWWGAGEIEFSEMLRIYSLRIETEGAMEANFTKEQWNVLFPVQYKIFPQLVLTWVKTDVAIINS